MKPTTTNAICGVGRDIGRSSRLIHSIAAILRFLLLAQVCAMHAWADDTSTFLQDRAAATPADNSYHWAQTPAEIQLDTIMALAISDHHLGLFARDTPGWDRRKARRFESYFSQPLLAAWRKREKDEVKKNCGGEYVEGDICGIDQHPILCADDFNEGGNNYRTDAASEDSVIVSYKWPQFESAMGWYRLIMVNGRWVLDGVYCHGD